MKTNKAAILLCAIAMSVASQGALADGHPCPGELDAVDAAIAAATFNGKRGEIDRLGMFGKVDEAIRKLKEEKYGDAMQKLLDISAKAEALATSPKQKLEDDTDIQTSIYYANQCISSL